MNATAPTLPTQQRLTLLETLRDSRVMAARQLRKTLRRPTYIVFSFVQPVIFVLLFPTSSAVQSTPVASPTSTSSCPASSSRPPCSARSSRASD